MIPCPQIGEFSRNIESESKPVRERCPLPRPIATVVRGWIRDDNTELGIGAGTRRFLADLFPSVQQSRPSPGVRPHERSLERRVGQLVVPGSGRRDPPGFRLFALTGRRSTAPNVVSPFSRSFGLFRRGPAQGPRPDHAAPPHGRLSRSLLFGRLFPVFPQLATDPPGVFGLCRLVG